MVSTVAGRTTSGYQDGVGTVATFNYPNGLIVDTTGSVWITDTNNHMIRRIDTGGNVLLHVRRDSCSKLPCELFL